MITRNVHRKINKALARLVAEDYNKVVGWALKQIPSILSLEI